MPYPKPSHPQSLTYPHPKMEKWFQVLTIYHGTTQMFSDFNFKVLVIDRYGHCGMQPHKYFKDGAVAKTTLVREKVHVGGTAGTPNHHSSSLNGLSTSKFLTG